MQSNLFSIMFFFLLVLYSYSCNSQTYNQYLFSEDIIDNSDRKNIDFSRIGNHFQALYYHDVNSYAPEDSLNSEQIDFFKSQHEILDARKFIYNQLKECDIFLLNEAHHNSQHRAFLLSLLPALKKIGFTHIGFESLDKNDENLIVRNYPTNKSGYFIQEPLFGNIIRESLENGLSIFPYEAEMSTYKEPVLADTILNREMKLIFHQMNFRDSIQAYNILQVYKSYPNAKIIIYGGYDHIKIGKDPHWKSMGMTLASFQELKVLSASQIEMTERGDSKIENPYYKAVSIKSPSVFLEKKSKNPFVYSNYIYDFEKDTTYNSIDYDVMIFHPRTKYIQNRPDWMYSYLDRKPFYPKRRWIKKLSFPILLMAYPIKENIKKSVPFDIIEIYKKEELKPLLLKKNKYKLLIKDRNNKISERKIHIN